MNENHNKHFSFMLNFIKEIRKVTDTDGDKYYSFFLKLISDAKKLTDENIEKINAGELRYQLFEKQKKSPRRSPPSNFDVETVVRELGL